MNDPRGRRLGAILWVAGMTGVIALSLTVLPQLLALSPTPAPVGLAVTASIVQSGVLLALAVWAGVALSGKLGLGAPVLEAVLARSPCWPQFKVQLVPAASAGLAVGLLLMLMQHLAPPALASAGSRLDIPLVARLLYGGVTEEVLMRWGLMTVLVWLPWRAIQKRIGPPRLSFMLFGIAAAAVLFGLLHLPAAAAMGVPVSASVALYIIVGNTVPGIVFGLLYWRRGIEAAIMAHALAHLVAVPGAVLS